MLVVVDEREVERCIALLDLPALMAHTLRAAARGEAGGPVRASLTTRDGVWFAAMPAWCGGKEPALGAKLVVAMPRNAARGMPTHRAVILLLDPHTGAPHAWVDGERLTGARTAAVSVVATETLAARPRGVHAILGAGTQARAHIDAYARGGLAKHLIVWARDASRAEALAAYARTRGIATDVARTADDAVQAADVVTTCTASAEPLFGAGAIAVGAHVNAVGACVATKRELPGALVGAASLVVDDAPAARAEAGDIVLAVADGDASWDGVVTLGQVLDGAVPRAGRATVFVSLGVGVEDVAAAAAIVALL